MRPAVVRGSSGRTRGRTSNYTVTITTPSPAGEATGKASKFPTLTPAPWAEHGACTSHPEPDLWHPTEGANHKQISKAKQVCGGCPVKMQCGQWAIQNHIPDGIYGGLTPHERGQISRSAERWQQRKREANA